MPTARRGKPWVPTDELLQLLFKKGIEHETRVLETMQLDRDVEIIDAPLVAAVAATEAAMARGAEVIYQAAFLHDGRRGHADFLCRADRPSRLGNWSYDVADTKLARRLKVPALLQMAAYGEHLRRIQGDPPRTLTVIAGDGVEHAVAFADVEAYARRVTARFDEFVRERPPTIADPVPHCDQCRWRIECTRGWREVDHLVLRRVPAQDAAAQVGEGGHHDVGRAGRPATGRPAALPSGARPGSGW